MRLPAAVVLATTLVAANPLAAQNIHPSPGPQAHAVRLEGPVRVDGKLDEAVWRSAPAATDFRQNQPNEGRPATQRTEVRFAFDDAAIYVGARMFDDSGARGVRTRLVRRDGDIASDYVQVIFDTYHDHIGRLFFLVNPSGVKVDANGLGGGGDNSWDPVWEVETTIDSLGWTAEMRIPFSEMRYPRTGEAQTWGLQIWRQEDRLNELSQWSFWGLQESGGPPQFGHLDGLLIQRAPGRGEVLPYVVGRSTNVPVRDAADPFGDPHAADGRFGADARILLTSNLTLNATVNPDFGQVEVDPAVVNLSAFETSFEEKRPFFVEGAGYFGFGGLNCFFCSNVSSLSMFYTRRIGRAPQVGDAAFANGGVWADLPENTTILGAAKLTGRTRSGWSIGAMDAVTRSGVAEVQRADSSYTTALVEPAANYFVARVARDFAGGARQLRFMATSVVRHLDGDSLMEQRLSSHAETFGVGGDAYFRRRAYRLMFQFAGSQVSGDSVAMLRLQRSSARYFQRPDRGQGGNGIFSDGYDSSATSLRGLGGYVRFSRETGKLLWEVSTNFRTPGFENNDIAFMSRADYWWMNANIYRQWTVPGKWYRYLAFIVGGQQQYNFDGDLNDRQVQTYGSVTLKNYWSVNTFYIYKPALLDERLSRGGPVLRKLANHFWSGSLSTDSRRRIVVNPYGDLGCNTEGDCGWDGGMDVQFKPASNISLSLGPSFGRSETDYQFVTSQADPLATTFYGRRYVFAHLDQTYASMNTRMNMTFTPTLSFELFMQPLISAGRYSQYKEFAAPRTNQRLEYGVDVGTFTRTALAGQADSLTIDPDANGATNNNVVLSDPSFTFRSLRGNAVVRWEYMPGSTLFLVWARGASSSTTAGDIDFASDTRALLRERADNVFVIKVNYRIGL